MRAEEPPEDGLVKVYDGDVLVAVIGRRATARVHGATTGDGELDGPAGER